jgi:1,4-alpha-glucan branching enzyme
LRKLNAAMEEHYPDVMTIAYDSYVPRNGPAFDGARLGFTFWWNTGWMHHSLSFIDVPPHRRIAHREKLTSLSSYAFDRPFVLPLPHSEAVAPNPSFLDRNPGEYEQKFAGYRAFLTYMMTFPGKKLGFMGYEFGQFRAWDPSAPLEWFLLDYPMHASAQLFVAELNHFYLSHPTLWEGDSSRESFRWLDTAAEGKCVLAYERVSSSGDTLAVIVNFSTEEYTHPIYDMKNYREVFSTFPVRCDGDGITLSPLSAVILERAFEENAQ